MLSFGIIIYWNLFFKFNKGSSMNFVDFILNLLNKKYEKRFLSLLSIKLKTDNISDPKFILEEIQQKAPLLFESYIKNNSTKNKVEITHIRIASFVLSVFSSLRMYYKDIEVIKSLIEEISSNIFYNEIKLLLNLSFIFSKNNLIAFWNYFLLLQNKFINILFDDSVKISKDYDKQKIQVKINPSIYKSFYEKHKIETLTLVSISYFDVIIKIIKDKYPELEITKDKDTSNLFMTYYLSYKK